MSTVDNNLSVSTLQDAWLTFQREALEVAAIPNGLAVALPQSLPDGWQMIVELHRGPGGKYKLTDLGRTLGWMSSRGQNVETPVLREHIQRISLESGLTQEGWEFTKWLDFPIAGLELHVFAEGLSNIAHLYYLHEPTAQTAQIADKTLKRVFSDCHLKALEGQSLKGKTEHAVRIDYLVPTEHRVAFQVLRRRGRIHSTMEQWGYRWQDLRKTNPDLRPAMVYDPEIQDVDEASKAIGEDVCDLFCAYTETDRIHELIESSRG